MALVLLAVAIHITFWASLHSGFMDPLFNDSTHRLPRGVDFFAVFQKSYEYSIGKSLYTDVDYSPEGLKYHVVPYCAQNYRYLPSWGWFVSRALVPLGAMNAYWLWVISCELMLLTCLWLFLKKTDDLRLRVGLIVIWLCFSPYYLELFMGQFTFMATGLLTLSLLAFESQRYRRGTVALVFSVLLKHMGLILMVPLILLGRWRSVLVTLAAVVVVCIIHFVPHPEDWPFFLAIAGYGTPEKFHAGNLGLQSLLGNITRLLPDQTSVLATGSQFLVLKALPVVLVLLLAWITWRYRSEKNLIPLCLMWLTAYFLGGSDVYEHHYVLLLPVFAFAWLRQPSRWLMLLYAWIALPTIFYFVDIHSLPQYRFFEVENIWWQRGHQGRVFIYHVWKITPTVWLLVWLFRVVKHPARSQSPA